MQRAQKLDDLGGKVVRLRDDGSVPPDNPFVGRARRAAGNFHAMAIATRRAWRCIPRPAVSG